MPAKGSKFSLANRDYIFDKKFYDKKLKSKEGFKLPYSDAKNVLETLNKNIVQTCITDKDGFKLPHGLGYLCVVRFIPKNPPIDWKKSKEVGKHVYYMNFHSLGYSARSRWFRVGRIRFTKFHEVYKFIAYKTFSGLISQEARKGKTFPDYTNQDFVEKSRLEKFYTKKYRKEQND